MHCAEQGIYFDLVESMDTFWEFCYGVRNMIAKEAPRKEPPRSNSPISSRAESPPQNRSYNCTNISCLNCVEDRSKWIHVKIKEHEYWLCSQDCWKEWLHSPEYVPWSPQRHFVPVREPPPLVLE